MVLIAGASIVLQRALVRVEHPIGHDSQHYQLSHAATVRVRSIWSSSFGCQHL